MAKPNGTYANRITAIRMARAEYKRLCAQGVRVPESFRTFRLDTGWGYALRGSDWDDTILKYGLVDVLTKDGSDGLPVFELSSYTAI